MTPEKFNDLIENIVIPLGQQICAKTNGMVIWNGSWKDRLRKEYEDNRKYAHSKMKHLFESRDGKIDRHKVGSIMLISILKTKTLIQNSEDLQLESPLMSSLCNELLSFRSAVNIVNAFYIEIVKESIRSGDKDEETGRKLIAKLTSPFVYPRTPDEGGYIGHAIKSLYHANKGNKLDIFIISNMLFLLEAYNLKSKDSEYLL